MRLIISDLFAFKHDFEDVFLPRQPNANFVVKVLELHHLLGLPVGEGTVYEWHSFCLRLSRVIEQL